MGVGIKTVWENFKLALNIMAWAGLLAGMISVWFLGLRYAPMQEQARHLDPRKNETLAVYSTFCEGHENIFSRVACHEFSLGRYTIDVPMSLFMFGAPYIALLPFGIAERAVLLSLAFLALFIQVGVFSLGSNQAVRRFYLVSYSSFCLIPPLFLRITRPRDCKMWKVAITGVLLSGIGSSLVVFFDEIAKNQLVFTIVLVPLIREVNLTPARLWSKTIAMNECIAGHKDNVRRNLAWCFMFMAQVFSATWVRMIVMSLTSTTSLSIYLVGSSLIEVLARLTVLERDKMVSKLVFGIWRSRRVEPIRFSRTQQSEQGACGPCASEPEWVSTIIVWEMLAEFLSIFLIFLFIVLFQGAKLTLPMHYFAMEKVAIYEQSDIPRAAVNTASQLFMELLVDTFCLVVESKILNAPVHRVWNSIQVAHKLFGGLFFALAGVSTAVIALESSLFHCAKVDESPDAGNICSCEFSKLTVFGKYCTGG